MKNSPVLVIGSSNFDLTIYCPRLPLPGETVIGHRFASAIGGKGANQATAAARAGAQVTFFSAVGDDSNGAAIRAHFEAERVNAHWAKTANTPATGAALILVDDQAQNSIAVAPGANAALEPQALDGVDFSVFSHVLISLEVPLAVVAEAARRARATGCTVLLNPAPAATLDDELLRNVDILIPNEHEVALLADGTDTTPQAGESASGAIHQAAATRFFGLGGQALIVTLGKDGARLITPSSTEVIPAFAVQAVDTVGAGDCFCGVLTAALATGHTLPEAIVTGSLASSLSVQTAGAIPSFPRQAQIDAGLLSARP